MTDPFSFFANRSSIPSLRFDEAALFTCHSLRYPSSGSVVISPISDSQSSADLGPLCSLFRRLNLAHRYETTLILVPPFKLANKGIFERYRRSVSDDLDRLWVHRAIRPHSLLLSPFTHAPLRFCCLSAKMLARALNERPRGNESYGTDRFWQRLGFRSSSPLSLFSPTRETLTGTMPATEDFSPLERLYQEESGNWAFLDEENRVRSYNTPVVSSLSPSSPHFI